jgi:hypothetical protein
MKYGYPLDGIQNSLVNVCSDEVFPCVLYAIMVR